MFNGKFLIVGFIVTLLSLLLGMVGDFKELLSSWLFVILYVFFLSIIGMWVGIWYEKLIIGEDNDDKEKSGKSKKRQG